MEVKKPTTYKQQIEILKSKGLIIEDEKRAINILKELNYYTFTGYLREFKIDEFTYEEGTTFDTVYHIIEFDRKLRNILLLAIEPIELTLKAKIAYNLGHKYGPLGYLYNQNFNNPKQHKMIVNNFEKNVRKNKNLSYVQHHNNKYDGNFPIWVAVNLFSFGMIYNLYSNLKDKDKEDIAKDFNTDIHILENWIECIVYLRNMVAHYVRLYNAPLNKSPEKCIKNHIVYNQTYKVFDILYVMKFMSLDEGEWNDDVVKKLKELLDTYNQYIDLDRIGFPKEWHKLLIK